MTTGITIYDNPQILQIAESLSRSTLIPQNYRNNVSDLLIAMDFANRLNVSPLAVMQNLYVIGGKPSWKSSFLCACINNSHRFSPLRPVYNADKTSCKCVATDLATGEDVEGFNVTIEFAKKEGYFDRNGSKWKTMPEQMLWYRAVSFFGNMYCPDIAAGIYTDYEVEDFVSPKEDVLSEEVNEYYSDNADNNIELIANILKFCDDNKIDISEITKGKTLDSFSASRLENLYAKLQKGELK